MVVLLKKVLFPWLEGEGGKKGKGREMLCWKSKREMFFVFTLHL